MGIITVSAWKMEERAEQRMSVGRLPDSINGRVRHTAENASSERSVFV